MGGGEEAQVVLRQHQRHYLNLTNGILLLCNQSCTNYLPWEKKESHHQLEWGFFSLFCYIKFQLFIIYYLFEILIKLILSFTHNAKGISLLVLIFLYFL